MRTIVKRIPFLKKIAENLNNQFARNDFIIKELKKTKSGEKILDAGCGSQRYKKYCAHLEYSGQDFGQYTVSEKIRFDEKNEDEYKYGQLDYVGDIWNIEEKDNYFDVILCTEVFEHIPYPIEVLAEFSRLLRPGGKLILTAPSNCLRHFDPYFFYSGFSDKWYEKFLKDNDLIVESITPVGDYYSWLSVEMARTAINHSLFAKLLLLPAFLYYYYKKPTDESRDTLCMGYHVVAVKA